LAVKVGLWFRRVRFDISAPDPRHPRRAQAENPPSALCRFAQPPLLSEPTFYAWKAKFGGMSVSDARRLKQLEDENAKLKKLLAEAMLDNAVLKDITSRKW
jgi:putative transposase